jgi:antitoxin HicB
MKRSTLKPREYRASIEPNEHGGYTVAVPALPELVTGGKNVEHARTMARDAVRCYIACLKKAKTHIPLERESAQIKISVIG